MLKKELKESEEGKEATYEVQKTLRKDKDYTKRFALLSSINTTHRDVNQNVNCIVNIMELSEKRL